MRFQLLFLFEIANCGCAPLLDDSTNAIIYYAYIYKKHYYKQQDHKQEQVALKQTQICQDHVHINTWIQASNHDIAIYHIMMQAPTATAAFPISLTNSIAFRAFSWNKNYHRTRYQNNQPKIEIKIELKKVSKHAGDHKNVLQTFNLRKKMIAYCFFCLSDIVVI